MKYLVVIFALIICSLNAHSASHRDKNVDVIQSPDERPCTFFKLEGVSIADPIRPDSGWFAIPLEHLGHDVIVSLLLSAHAAENKVMVYTTGELACGHAAVRFVRT